MSSKCNSCIDLLFVSLAMVFFTIVFDEVTIMELCISVEVWCWTFEELGCSLWVDSNSSVIAVFVVEWIGIVVLISTVLPAVEPRLVDWYDIVLSPIELCSSSVYVVSLDSDIVVELSFSEIFSKCYYAWLVLPKLFTQIWSFRHRRKQFCL